MENTSQILLRQIPPMERLLEAAEIQPLALQCDRPFLLSIIRSTLDSFRQDVSRGTALSFPSSGLLGHLIERIQAEFQRQNAPSLRKVVNATGIVLHTNLGRAPLGKFALDHLRNTAEGYSNLEYDLAEGCRGKRDTHLDSLLCGALGCEQALVVNNNAAAVFLILNSLAEDREVLISRGELVEIGDSFRLPDILEKSGARLREVGATNKTHLTDYAGAIRENTAIILRVHPSNFRMEGFTSKPTLAELAELCRLRSLLLVEDQGSGCLKSLQKWGVQEDSLPAASLVAGADLVCFSGDKLLGGPQAGIIAGKKELIGIIRRNPLFRTYRADKLCLAALEGTLLAHRQGRLEQELPLFRMLAWSRETLRPRALLLLEELGENPEGIVFEVIDSASKLGGGSTPEQEIPSSVIALSSSRHSLSSLEKRLRRANPPVVARIENDRLILDLRTVLPEEEGFLLEALKSLANPED
jgi:L-seryl-tRNA(Ser) seleniumtransferase